MDGRFYTIDFDHGNHVVDLLRTIANGGITCIVDEDAGGIVAYVIDPAGYHRGDEFAAALNVADEG